MATAVSSDPLWSALRAYRGRLSIATLLICASAGLELVPHLVVYAAAVEVFAPTPDVSALAWLVALAFGAVVLRFLMLGTGYILSHGVAFKVLRALRLRLTAKLARVSASVLKAHPSGDLKKVIVDDVASLEGLFAHHLPELTSGILVPLLGAGILLWSDWRLALLALAMMPVAIGVQAFAMRGYGDEWAKWHAAEARANEGVLEFIRGVVVLKAFDRDASSLARVRQGIHGIRDLAVAMTRRSMGGYALFFALLSGNLLVVLPAGLWLYLSGDIGREQLVLFIAIGAGLMLPLTKLLVLFGNMQHIQAALARIRVLASAEEVDEPDTPAPEPAETTVRFEGVAFAYPGRTTAAVEGVDFTLPPATTTAIVGPSGAGKTTLFKLLVRAADPDAGRISIGGVDLRALTAAQRVARVSHVSQDTTLFDGSVADNLRLARPDAPIEALEAACRAADAHDFIAALPDGYDTALGDRGARLSGGERQRIAIARALLKGAPIIALDEVTANVDPDSERGIQRGIAALAAERTVVVVAHRLRTVAHVDRLLVMDRGRLIDHGTHAELLARCAVYAEMWRAQEDAEGWMLTGGAL